jgi:hypothetical protein
MNKLIKITGKILGGVGWRLFQLNRHAVMVAMTGSSREMVNSGRLGDMYLEKEYTAFADVLKEC